MTWSGFETPDAVAHGLHVRKYTDHLDQMKSLGFNMIRLAFAGDTLKKSTYPNGNIYGANPELRVRPMHTHYMQFFSGSALGMPTMHPQEEHLPQ